MKRDIKSIFGRLIFFTLILLFPVNSWSQTYTKLELDVTTAWGQKDYYMYKFDVTKFETDPLSYNPCNAVESNHVSAISNPKGNLFYVGCTSVAVGQLINYYFKFDDYKDGWLDVILQGWEVWPRFVIAGKDDPIFDGCDHSGFKTNDMYVDKIENDQNCTDNRDDTICALIDFLWNIAIGLDSYFIEKGKKFKDKCQQPGTEGGRIYNDERYKLRDFLDKIETLLVDRLRFNPQLSHSSMLKRLDEEKDYITKSITRGDPVILYLGGKNTKNNCGAGHLALITGYKYDQSNKDQIYFKINFGWANRKVDNLPSNRYYPGFSSFYTGSIEWNSFSVFKDTYPVIRPINKPLTKPLSKPGSGFQDCSNKKNDVAKPQATAIVFDHSGSMQEEMKIDYAREAAVTYERNMEETDSLSVSIFNDSAQTPQGLEMQPKSGITVEWHANLLANNPGGATNIGAGLSKGLDQLCSISGNEAKKDALLLSDGMNNRGQYNTIVQKYIGYEIPIHTVKFGQNASEQNLKKIAEDTGGTYRAADQFTISNSYSSIFNTINGNSEVLATHDLMGPGDTTNYLAAISHGADALNLNASWQGSRLRVKLTSPSGNVYYRDQLPDINDRFEESKINQFTKIKNPESGAWRIDVEWEIPPSIPERVNLLLSEHTDVYTSILGFNPEYTPGQKVVINVQASDLDGGNNKKPLRNASVWAKVQIPGQEMIRMIHAQGSKFRVYEDVIKDLSRKVEMFDDGMHDDYKAGDGIFGAHFTETQINGSYIVKAYIEGQKENGSAVNRKSVSSFQVGPLRNTKVNTSQIMNFTHKVEEEKLKSKVYNPLGTMQGGSTSQKHTTPVPSQPNTTGGSQVSPVPPQTQTGGASQGIPATKSSSKKSSRSLMDKVSN